MFILIAHDGHIFYGKRNGSGILLTNEYGMQTKSTLAYALRLLGGNKYEIETSR